jgi:Uma2 family endonuclease
MATADHLLTAEEFAHLPDDGRRYELVRGVLVEMNMPKPRHGQVCGRVQAYVFMFCDGRLGHVLSNDSGVVTERAPDTVRGADVCFYSYAKVPRGPLGNDYLDVAPDVVFEVLSPDDRALRVMRKTREYLEAGVMAVVIIDPQHEEVEIHRLGRPVEEVPIDGDIRVPEIAADFSLSVRILLA